MDSKENSGLSAKLRHAASMFMSPKYAVDATLMAEAADLIDTQASTIAERTRERDNEENYGAQMYANVCTQQRQIDEFTATISSLTSKLEAAEKLAEAWDKFRPSAQVAFLWQVNGAKPGEVERYRDGYQAVLTARTTLADIRGDGK